MIKHWIITGDTHGRVQGRLEQIAEYHTGFKPEETGIIILGDAGINFYLNKTDRKNKTMLSHSPYTIYCVRGNHEERPENISSMIIKYDKDVHGDVYLEEEFPNIRYFMDGGEYIINDKTCLVLGGAYSIDKWHRLKQISEPGAWCGWFKDEQLSEEERAIILKKINDKHYNFIFSHTCPRSLEPKDLFLEFVDQSTVDKTMEDWLEKVKNSVHWNVWCFGHFHADRIETECVEQFYRYFEPMNNIWNRWYGGNTKC